MNESTPRYWEVFLEVFEALPRQGPGRRDCAARAFDLCRGLPPAPAVLDLGCGGGAQTLHLADLVSGNIVAVDRHVPFVERLRRTVAERGLSHRIWAIVADMEATGFPPESFDLIWSEGALYNLGIEKALRICRALLRNRGSLAFTDAVWRKEDPPPEVRALFEGYPGMGWASDVLAAIERSGFEPLGHYALPDEAWWDDFYTPMKKRLQVLRAKYSADREALSVLDRIDREPELHRKYSDYYAYEFFVARKECR